MENNFIEVMNGNIKQVYDEIYEQYGKLNNVKCMLESRYRELSDLQKEDLKELEKAVEKLKDYMEMNLDNLSINKNFD